jgi:hypothetical protein
MSEKNSMSRRTFVSGTSSLVLAGAMGEAGAKGASNQASKLAIDGGEKAVKVSCPAVPRWGEREFKQLSAMLKQTEDIDGTL